jgi:GTPase Era involved in 16S rRNA processing
MVYAYSELTERAQTWAQQAVDQHQMDAELPHDLFKLDERMPDSLFAKVADRPLIVAFMGGTGVGKSTLLNRLAGQDIARTGVERPTSREVTLFHHDTVTITQLPAGLPIDKVRVSQHHDDEKRNIVWIDMPDFDSIELTNKSLVLEWLPHIDVLLYVVSPERYRDNKAWQLLLSEGARHAWLFVLNQWDRGQSSQFEDFKLQLSKAGFADPMVFKTDCSAQPAEDEFTQLVDHLLQLSTGNNVINLEQRGRESRLRELQKVLEHLHEDLAEHDYQALIDFFQLQWQKTRQLLLEGFNWPLKQMAIAYAKNPGNRADNIIWDEWAQSRFNDLLDQVIDKASMLKLPVKPLKNGVKPVRENIATKIVTQTELGCRQALLHPGNGVQRSLLKILRVSEFLLPLTAMVVVGYEIFSEFYEGAMLDDRYLGTNFAIHSTLLIAISWLLPFFLHKKMQPSLEKAARTGLQKGIEVAFIQIETEIDELFESQVLASKQMNQQLNDLITDCKEAINAIHSPVDDKHLERMLPAKSYPNS